MKADRVFEATCFIIGFRTFFDYDRKGKMFCLNFEKYFQTIASNLSKFLQEKISIFQRINHLSPLSQCDNGGCY